LTGIALVPSRLHRDERLARLAADGNREAFAVIYERYHQVLYRYCHSILGNPQDAFDATATRCWSASRLACVIA